MFYNCSPHFALPMWATLQQFFINYIINYPKIANVIYFFDFPVFNLYSSLMLCIQYVVFYIFLD